MPTTEEVTCPKCGGAMWDNRATKTNPKAPDFKCRDKACDGVVWPPKNGAPRAAAPRPAAPVKQAYSAGPPLPYEEAAAGFSDGTNTALPHEKLDHQFRVYDLCLDHAHAAAQKRFGKDVTDEAVAAMTATLFIAATKAGV